MQRDRGREFTGQLLSPKTRAAWLAPGAGCTERFTCPDNAAKMPAFLNHPTFPRGSAVMKNVYEVLREKEAQLRKIQVEVEALRVAAPLLSESESEAENESNGSSRRAAGQAR